MFCEFCTFFRFGAGPSLVMRLQHTTLQRGVLTIACSMRCALYVMRDA